MDTATQVSDSKALGFRDQLVCPHLHWSLRYECVVDWLWTMFPIPLPHIIALLIEIALESAIDNQIRNCSGKLVE